MLLNLKRVYVRMHSFPQARDITELLLAVDPSALNELRDRGLLAYHLKDFSAALRDLQAYLQLSAIEPARRRRARGARADLGARQDAAPAGRVAELRLRLPIQIARLTIERQSRNHQIRNRQSAIRDFRSCPRDSLEQRTDVAVRIGLGAGRARRDATGRGTPGGRRVDRCGNSRASALAHRARRLREVVARARRIRADARRG